MKTLFSILTCFIFVTAMGQKPAVVIKNDPGWHKIGQVKLSFQTESESMNVMGADAFKAIKLRAKDSPVTVVSVNILYEAGETESIPLAMDLMPGEETKIMDIKLKDIKTVSITCKAMSNSNREKAELELWGLK